MSAHAELSSASSLLDDLVARISAIAAALDATDREALGGELAEVERHLGNARRRLTRLVEATA
ncbi:MAG TPA: hypothetical protein VKU91_01230 [Acidimicrobiales bacterium]|nr:hypothetical protein [Acidimicrobiales bacterium]